MAPTFTAKRLATIPQVVDATGYASESSFDDEWQTAEVEETEPRNPTAPQAAHPSLGDRRRPGRSEYVHPALISLLRRSTVAIEANFGDDDLRPAQGLMTAVLLSLPCWLLVGTGIGLLLSRS